MKWKLQNQKSQRAKTWVGYLGWRLGLGAADHGQVFSSRSVAVGGSRWAEVQRQIADGWTRSGRDWSKFGEIGIDRSTGGGACVASVGGGRWESADRDIALCVCVSCEFCTFVCVFCVCDFFNESHFVNLFNYYNLWICSTVTMWVWFVCGVRAFRFRFRFFFFF